MIWSVASERSEAVDGGNVSTHNLNGVSRSIEHLSGGLVLSEWAGITVTRMVPNGQLVPSYWWEYICAAKHVL